MLQPEKVSGEAAEEVAHARAMSGGFRPLSSYFRQADLPYDCGMQEQLCVCCHCQAEMRRPAALVCSRCHLAFYCSRDCQVAYHKKHAKWCKRESSAQAALRAASPQALVLSSRLALNLYAWASAGREVCPDARYFFRKTDDVAPVFHGRVSAGAKLATYWQLPRPAAAAGDDALPPKAAAVQALLSRLAGGQGAVCKVNPANDWLPFRILRFWPD
jgi:hypothetical protein